MSSHQDLSLWICSRAKLSRPLNSANFADSLSNGFLLGELLAALGLKGDFSHFIDDNEASSILGNFQRLDTPLLELNIKLSDRMINDIIAKRPAAGRKLLTKIRTRYQQMCACQKQAPPTEYMTQVDIDAEDKTFMGENKESMSERDLKLLQQINVNEVTDTELRLRSFYETQTEIEIMFEAEAKKEQRFYLHDKQCRRKLHLKRHQMNRDFKASWEADGQRRWRRNQLRGRAREKEELRMELTIRERRLRRDALRKRQEMLEVQACIDEFDGLLTRAGQSSDKIGTEATNEHSEGQPSSLNPAEDSSNGTGNVRERSGELNMLEELARLRRLLPAQHEMQKEADAILRELRGKALAARTERKERTSNQRRLLETHRTQTPNGDELESNETVLESLMAEDNANNEIEMARSIWTEVRWNRFEAANRKARHDANMQHRAALELEAEQRKQSRLRALEEKRSEELKLFEQIEEKLRVEHEAKQKRKNMELCTESVYDLTELAATASEYRQSRRVSLVPANVFKRWLYRLGKGWPIYPVASEREQTGFRHSPTKIKAERSAIAVNKSTSGTSIADSASPSSPFAATKPSVRSLIDLYGGPRSSVLLSTQFVDMMKRLDSVADAGPQPCKLSAPAWTVIVFSPLDGAYQQIETTLRELEKAYCVDVIDFKHELSAIMNRSEEEFAEQFKDDDEMKSVYDTLHDPKTCEDPLLPEHIRAVLKSGISSRGSTGHCISFGFPPYVNLDFFDDSISVLGLFCLRNPFNEDELKAISSEEATSAAVDAVNVHDGKELELRLRELVDTAEAAVPASVQAEAAAAESGDEVAALGFEQAVVLRKYWQSVEHTYEQRVSLAFANVRSLVSNSETALAIDREAFLKALNAPFPTVPQLVDKFAASMQEDLNKKPYGEDLGTSRHLSERIDMLSDQLWAFVEKRRDEAEQRANALSQPKWLEELDELCGRHFSIVVKAERERFEALVQFVGVLHTSEGIDEFVQHQRYQQGCAESTSTAACNEILGSAIALNVLTVSSIQQLEPLCISPTKSITAVLQAELRLVNERCSTLESHKMRTIKSVLQLVRSQQRRLDSWIGMRLQDDETFISQLCASLTATLRPGSTLRPAMHLPVRLESGCKLIEDDLASLGLGRIVELEEFDMKFLSQLQLLVSELSADTKTSSRSCSHIGKALVDNGAISLAQLPGLQASLTGLSWRHALICIAVCQVHEPTLHELLEMSAEFCVIEKQQRAQTGKVDDSVGIRSFSVFHKVGLWFESAKPISVLPTHWTLFCDAVAHLLFDICTADTKNGLRPELLLSMLCSDDVLVSGYEKLVSVLRDRYERLDVLPSTHVADLLGFEHSVLLKSVAIRSDECVNDKQATPHRLVSYSRELLAVLVAGNTKT